MSYNLNSDETAEHAVFLLTEFLVRKGIVSGDELKAFVSTMSEIAPHLKNGADYLKSAIEFAAEDLDELAAEAKAESRPHR